MFTTSTEDLQNTMNDLDLASPGVSENQSDTVGNVCSSCEIKLFTPQLRAQHYAGKKHAARVKHLDRVSRSVHISGWPGHSPSEVGLTCDAIKSFCEQYEAVEDVKLTDAFAFVCFESVRGREACISSGSLKLHVIDPVSALDKTLILLVRPAFPDKLKAGKKKGQPGAQRTELMQAMSAIKSVASKGSKSSYQGSIHEQLEALAKSRQITITRRREFEIAIAAIDRIAKHCFGPQTDVYPYGSFVTGLGSSSSDVDLSISCGSQQKGECEMLDQLEEYVKRDTSLKFVVKVESKCPILKVYHIGASVQCEISINNGLAVANTSLVCAYLNLSKNLNLVCHTMKLWASLHRLKLSGYSVTLMVIFYFQMRKLLPTLQQSSGAHLKKSDGYKRKRDHSQYGSTVKRMRMLGEHHQETESKGSNVEDRQQDTAIWDTSFSTDTKAVPEKAIELNFLAGFFDFYHSYNWVQHAVSVRTGEIMEISNIGCKPHPHIPTSIVIEDPFELVHNTCSWMPRASAEQMIVLCKHCNDLLFRTNNLNSILDARLGKNRSEKSNEVSIKERPRKIAKYGIKISTEAAFKIQDLNDIVISTLREVGIRESVQHDARSLPNTSSSTVLVASVIAKSRTWRSNRKLKRSLANQNSSDHNGADSLEAITSTSTPSCASCNLFSADISLLLDSTNSGYVLKIDPDSHCKVDAFQEFYALFKRSVVSKVAKL